MMTSQQEETFRTLYASGATWQEIGHEVGIDPSWLSVLRKRMGIPEHLRGTISNMYLTHVPSADMLARVNGESGQPLAIAARIADAVRVAA